MCLCRPPTSFDRSWRLHGSGGDTFGGCPAGEVSYSAGGCGLLEAGCLTGWTSNGYTSDFTSLS